MASMTRAEEALERKRMRRPGETDMQHQIRVMQMDADLRDQTGPLVSREAHQHGRYKPGFVMHVESRTLAHTQTNRSFSSLAIMHRRGSISNDQFVSSQTIIRVYEMLKRDADVQCASLEARVDNSGGRRTEADERLWLVRAEIAYTLWRSRSPVTKAMILDMLTSQSPMKMLVRDRYKMGWPAARDHLKDALDEFAIIHKKVFEGVKKGDLDAAQARLED